MLTYLWDDSMYLGQCYSGLYHSKMRKFASSIDPAPAHQSAYAGEATTMNKEVPT